MLFYSTLFLAFLYFKIARVHKKEERMTGSMAMQHLVSAIAMVSLAVYGSRYCDPYHYIPSFFLFATIASMMITAVQVGIFINGKPLTKMSDVYYFLPVLTSLIALMSIAIWM